MKTLRHLSFSLSISRNLLFLDSDLEPASGSKGGSRGTTKRGTGLSEPLVSSCRVSLSCEIDVVCECCVCARTHACAGEEKEGEAWRERGREEAGRE